MQKAGKYYEQQCFNRRKKKCYSQNHIWRNVKSGLSAHCISNKNASISVSELFETAGQCGYLWELEKLCRTNALKNATQKPHGVKLFINVDGNVLRDSNFIKGFTKEKLNAYSLKADNIVFEITERSNSDNYQLLRDTMEQSRNGCRTSDGKSEIHLHGNIHHG